MTLFRYKAVPVDSQGSALRSGEISGSSEENARASLRRIGMQVIDIRPAHRPTGTKSTHKSGRLNSVASRFRSTLSEQLATQQRNRRRLARSELFDSLSTLLRAGVPLLQAFETILNATDPADRSKRQMLAHVREQLQGGETLAGIMGHHGNWFDPTEVAMVDAGQHSGTLTEVLRTLSTSQQRAQGLYQRLVGALTYPAIVSLVGIGVVVFLSTKTLPDLVQILVDSNVSIPALTRYVMATGQFVASYWWMLLLGIVLLTLASLMLRSAAEQNDGGMRRLLIVWQPVLVLARRFRILNAFPGTRVLRRVRLAQATMQIAELLRSGVPMVEALRVVAPTTPSRKLGKRLRQAATEVERGEELATAFGDDRWFDAEFQRLLAVGQSTGELDELLERIAERYQRQAARLIDRLAALLEPLVILLLAIGVGIVVISAVLPLVRLQEILS